MLLLEGCPCGRASQAVPARPTGAANGSEGVAEKAPQAGHRDGSKPSGFEGFRAQYPEPAPNTPNRGGGGKDFNQDAWGNHAIEILPG